MLETNHQIQRIKTELAPPASIHVDLSEVVDAWLLWRADDGFKTLVLVAPTSLSKQLAFAITRGKTKH